jgi:eukaryotic-like serine/threonine-protein kinase
VAASDDYIGRTVASKYRVEQMIGEGGMGKVYKATQIALDKPVVLKVLRQALLSDQRTVARFQREAKAASRLNHPNSISVLDFGQAEDGAMYIAMEYVQGKDLHHILSREWPLSESRVIRIMGQVLSALADAHSASVIHRDLKPENIMVEQRRGGEPDFVKVLDFGIAKIIDGSNDDGPALTRAGFVCGTPEYMSPEQARGAHLDHRSDLYAVGVIVYQLMTGMLPFDSDSAVGFATKHLTEVPLTPSRRRPDARVSPAMERLIMKALAKNPDDRPQTAEQFRAELQAIEKERRAGASASRRGLNSVPSLAPIRKVTPPDQQETRVNPHPGSSPWGMAEDTVKGQALPPPAAAPSAKLPLGAKQRGPVPEDPVVTAPTTSPDRKGLFGEASPRGK